MAQINIIRIGIEKLFCVGLLKDISRDARMKLVSDFACLLVHERL